MRLMRDYRRIALAVTAVSVVAAYGAALAYPVDRPERSVLEWISLPDVQVKIKQTVQRPSRLFNGASVAELHERFDAADFKLGPVRQGDASVPRVFVEALPGDYNKLQDIDTRKRTFFKTVLPLILKVNEEIRTERNRLVQLQEQMLAGRELPAEQREWLEALADKYRTTSADFTTLLRRVDMISPAVALAQSVEESGWGRSRFARKGNALFGQRSWSEGGGLVPKEREDGANFEVRAFDSLLDSVRSYALNLNRHPAYADYRVARARMRATETQLDPITLTNTLLHYSERRGEYVRTLQTIINGNDLHLFEPAKLTAEGADGSDVQVAQR